MRIAVCANSLVDPNPSGTKTFLCEVIRRWGADPGRGVQITIAVPDPSAEASLRRLLPEVPWRAVQIPMSRWPRRLRWLLGGGSIGPQIGAHDIHLSGWHWPLGRSDRPFVGIVHDLAPLEEASAITSVKRWIYRWLYRVSLMACCTRADAIVCVSRHTMHKLCRLRPDSESRCRVIPHGIDQEGWRSAPSAEQTSAALNRCGIRDGSEFVLALGRHVANKNFMTLLRAFHRHVAPAVPNVKLILAGGHADQTPSMQRYVDEQRLGDRVVMPGFVAEAELRVLMQRASAFAYPSLIEGFGIPVLEAFAAGTPVVCSNTASLPEVAGDAALLVDPRDADALGSALFSVLTDQRVRRDLIQRGAEQASKFTWESCADAYLDLFQQICLKHMSPVAQ